MENLLRFKIEQKQYPYSDNAGMGNLENWGQIKILILRNTDQVLLLEHQWHLFELAIWFLENEEFLRSEHLSIYEKFSTCPGESLAQALERLQNQEFLDEEEQDRWYDMLYEFREHHALRFAMRGANIPNIIIGVNQGLGEISLSDQNDDWCYSFDMNDFLADTKKKLDAYSAVD
jgi:hypothetical protein